MWCCKFANNDSFTNCLSLSYRFRLSLCFYKAITSAESFEHFCFLSVVKSSGASLFQDASLVTIMSRSSKMFTDSDYTSDTVILK